MILTKIELLESYGNDQQLMCLTFDGGKDSAYIFWSYANLMQYLNEEVIATFRQDMYNGVISKFVNTLACVGVVQTLERESNVKLYSNVNDNHCTIQFNEIREGGSVSNAIVYVVDICYNSSIRAEWADLTVMDRARKVAQLRIFSPDSRIEEFKGRYVMCDIRRNRYGFSTDSIVTIDSAFPVSPDVEIGARFLMETFAEDQEMLRVLSDSRFIEFAKECVDLEPGYILVRLALELDLASELTNLLSDVDVTLIKRCLLAEKFYLLHPNSAYEKNITSFVAVSKHNFQGRSDVLDLLYAETTKYTAERAILVKVKELADTIVKVKKGMLK